MDSKEFKKVIDTNLLGTFLVTKYISKLMNNNSSIINILYCCERDQASRSIDFVIADLSIALAQLSIPGWTLLIYKLVLASIPSKNMHRLAGFAIELREIYNKQPV